MQSPRIARRLIPLVLVLLVLPLAATTMAQQARATLTNVAITSGPASGETYGAGETIRVTATFSEAVTVTGVPYVELTVGTATRQADYASGSGSTAIVFKYTVKAGDKDSNGASIPANSLSVPTGASIQDENGNNADRNHAAVPDQQYHKVHGIGVTSLAITSEPESGDTYQAGETIQVTATFSEAVTVTGVPFLRLRVGSAIEPADYASGSGSTAIVFEYEVVARDRDTDGVSIPSNPIVKVDKDGNSATIKGSGDTDANPNHGGVSDQAGHKVDGSAAVPTITYVGTWSYTDDYDGNPADTYTTGNVIAVRVAFSEEIVVTGTPTLAVTIGTSTRTFSYNDTASTPYSDSAIFEYTVAAGDSDDDGISIPANSLSVPTNASIQDTDGNDAVLTHDALAAQAEHKVSTQPGGM